MNQIDTQRGERGCLRPGRFIDVRDNYGQWKVGYILTIHPNVKIRYDGLESKFDEVILFFQQTFGIQTFSFKPFREFTRGYTGSKNTPAVRKHWILSADDLRKRTMRLSNFIGAIAMLIGFEVPPSIAISSNEMPSLTLDELIQYLRGQHFFYIDFLLSSTPKDTSMMASIFNYFGIHLKIQQWYLQWFNGSLDCLLSSKSLSTLQTGFLESYYEIFDATCNILIGNRRNASFFNLIAASPPGLIQQYPPIYIQELKTLSGFIISAVKKLQSWQNELFPVPFLQIWATMHSTLDLYHRQIDNQQKQLLDLRIVTEKAPRKKTLPPRIFSVFQMKEFTTTLFNVLSRCIPQYSPSQLKHTEAFMENIFTNMQIGYQRYRENPIYLQFIKENRLIFYHKLLQTDSLDKKLKAIAKFKEIAGMIESKVDEQHPEKYRIIQTSSTIPGSTNADSGIPVITGGSLYSPRFIKEWLEKSRLIELVFEHNQNVQVIRKACQVVKQFYICGVIGAKDLAEIWKYSLSKHQAYKKCIFTFWNQLPSIIRIEEFQEVSSLYLQTSIISNYVRSDSTSSSSSHGPVNLCSFYEWEIEEFLKFVRAAVKKWGSSHSIVSQLLDKTKTIALCNPDNFQLMDMVAGCMIAHSYPTGYIQRSWQDDFFHLKNSLFDRPRCRFLYRLLRACGAIIFYSNHASHPLPDSTQIKYFGQKPLLPADSLDIIISQILKIEGQSIESLREAFDLLNQLLTWSLCSAKTRVIREDQSPEQKSKFSGTAKITSDTSVNHLESRSEPSQQQKLRLTKKHLETLFQHFSSETLGLPFRNIFYSWLLVSNLSYQQFTGQPFYSLNSHLNPELKEYLFQNYLLNSQKIDFINMTEIQWLLFEEFFVDFNKDQGRLIKITKMGNWFFLFSHSSDQELEGIEKLQYIILNCKDVSVISRAVKLLLTLYLNQGHGSNQKAEQDRLLAKIGSFLEESYHKNNIARIRAALMLYLAVLDYLGDQDVQPSPLRLKTEGQKIQLIVNLPNNLKDQFSASICTNFTNFNTSKGSQIQSSSIKVAIYAKEPFLTVVREVQNAIGVPGYRFILSNKQKLIERSSYRLPYFTHQFPDKTFLLHPIKKGLSSYEYAVEKIRSHQRILIMLLAEEKLAGLVLRVLDQLPKNWDICNQLMTMKNNKNYWGGLNVQVYLMDVLKEICSESVGSLNQEEIALILLECILPERFGTPLEQKLGTLFLQLFSLIFTKDVASEGSSRNQMVIGKLFSFGEIIQLTLRAETYVGRQLPSLLKSYFTCLQMLFGSNSILLRLYHEKKLLPLLSSVYQTKTADEIQKLCTDVFILFQSSYSPDKLLEVINFLLQLIIGNGAGLVEQGHQPPDSRCYYFLKLIAGLLEGTLIKGIGEKKSTLAALAKDLSSKLIKTISSELETLTSGQNKTLCGCLYLLKVLVRSNPALATQELEWLIVDNLLFVGADEELGEQSIQAGEYSPREHAICCHEQTVKQAIELLSEVLNFKYLAYSQSNRRIEEKLRRMHGWGYWRKPNKWNVKISEEAKSASGFVGLENPGCICFMNSFFQQLYMNIEFRNCVLAYQASPSTFQPSTSIDSLQPIESITWGLYELFVRLQHSDEQAINAFPYSRFLKSTDGKPLIKVFEQMDIDEFASLFLDRVESALAQEGKLKNQSLSQAQTHTEILLNSGASNDQILPPNNFVRRLFGGSFSEEIIPSDNECHHASSQEAAYLTLLLDVKKNLYESLDALVKEEVLQGQNKYHCEVCDRKVKVKMRKRFKKLPKYLMLALKRFEFNFEVSMKVKINDYCQFPMDLELANYTITDHDLAVSTKYILKGVSVHTGTSEYGHYYSIIRDYRDLNKWYEFNDNYVTEFNPEDIPEECFGSQNVKQIKTKNAYILFYQRSDTMSGTPIELEPSLELLSRIKRENRILAIYKILFGEAYAEFMGLRSQKVEGPQSRFTSSTIISYILGVRWRTRDIHKILDAGDKIIYLLKNSPAANFSAEQFLREISMHLEEFFVYNPQREKAKIMASLIGHIFETLISKSSVMMECQPKKLPPSIIYFLSSAATLLRRYSNICQLLSIIRKAALHYPQILCFLEELRLTQIILENIIGKKDAKPDSNDQETTTASSNCQGQHFQHHPLLSIIKDDSRPPCKTSEREAWYYLYLLFKKDLNLDQSCSASTPLVRPIQQNVILKTFKELSTKKLQTLISDCSSTKALVCIGSVLSLLIRSSLEGENLILQALKQAFCEFECTRFRPYFIVVEVILKNYSKSKITASHRNLYRLIADLFMKALLHNENYYIECDFMHQWILRYCSMCIEFGIYLKSEGGTLVGYIWNRLEKRTLPTPELLKKHRIATNQRLLNRMQGIMISHEVKFYEETVIKFKMKVYASLRDGTWGTYIYTPLPQIDQEYKSECGVFAYIDLGWKEGVVKNARFDLLELKLQQKTIQLWEDDEKLLLK